MTHVLLNAPEEADSSPFTIVLNWTGLLKKVADQKNTCLSNH